MKHKASDARVVESRLIIPITFMFRAVTAEDKCDVVVVRSVMEATYEIEEGFVPTTEQITAFKDGNAVFNCWTYFREIVQSTVARMEYPPITLPFLRMVPKRVSVEQPPPAIEMAVGNLPPGEPHEQQPAVPRRRKGSKDGG
jgi:hypothetical protein